jgi:hypothetical protein
MSLAGRLKELAISDIFQILSVGKKSGTLIIQGGKGTAVILFKNGLIFRAETDDLEGNLGDNLLDAGLIKDTIRNMAVEVKKKLPSKSIAEILFDFGSVSKATIDKIAKKRIEKIISRILLWEDGDFQFELDDLTLEGKTNLPDFGWELSKGLSPEYLLMEGARIQDESTQNSFSPFENSSAQDSEESPWDEDWSSQPAERNDISALKLLTQELRFPNSSSEITLLILRFASDIFRRGVLFMVGKDEIIGLGQFGLDIEGAEENVREIVLSTDKSPFFKKIILQRMPYRGVLEKDEATRLMIGELGGVWPSEVALYPLIAEGSVVVLLYCDNFPTGKTMGETTGLEIFIDQAGLAIEKSLLQRRLQKMEMKKGLTQT